jgi:pentatricopeptide repeat protein
MWAHLANASVVVLTYLSVSKSISSVSWAFPALCGDIALYVVAALLYAMLVQSRRASQSNTALAEKWCKAETSGPDEDNTVTRVLVQQSKESKKLYPNVQEPAAVHGASVKVVKPEFDINEQVKLMETYALQRNISATVRIFNAMKKQGALLNGPVYNTVLLAWIKCGNVQAAEDWMEEMEESGMTDETSYNILVHGLVKACALDKAIALLRKMKAAHTITNATMLQCLLCSLSEEGRADEGISLFEEFCMADVAPTCLGLSTLVRLVNSSRCLTDCKQVIRLFRAYGMEPCTTSYRSALDMKEIAGKGQEPASALKPVIPWPHMAALLLRAPSVPSQLISHEVYIMGSLARIKAGRKALKQYGFMDKGESDEWPLNGQWETDHGLHVIIEGKMVRWSHQRASRLSFTQADRRTCKLTVYGEVTQGRLLPPTPDESKTLRWDNGDVWRACESRIVGKTFMLSQTMSKTKCDTLQDEAHRVQMQAALQTVSKQRLSVPSLVEDNIVSFIGKNLYYVQIHFQSKWSPSVTPSSEAAIFDILSRRHPHIGFRHCWLEPHTGCCGQRVLVNGGEVSEDIFTRHVKSR